MDTSVADPLVGQLLDGRYRIESRIARGGMATVYLARDSRLDRVVAVKVMHAALAADEDFVDRFIGEAKAAAALSHPNVVAVYDQGTDGERGYLVMEYVAGRTLRDALAARGRFGPRAALEIMQPVLAALGAAHRAGLVHRDIKPENVLITDDGQVKVTDFGLARAESASKMTRTGVIIGTVGYLAPEQVTSGSADVRSDVYAAGVLLFELLTGRLPHEGDTPLAVAYKHVNETVPPPSELVPGLPYRVDELVTDATSHEPARRPQDANRYLAEVAEVHGGLPPDIDARLEEASRTATSVLEAPAPPDATRVDGDPAGDGRTAMLPPAPRDGQVLHFPEERGHTAVLDVGADPAGPPRSRGDRVIGALTGRWVLVAIGVIAAVILGWAVWYQTSGQYDHVPSDIVGMELADARGALADAGIDVRVAEPVYHDRVRKGLVAESDPGGGARVAQGETVTLTPSKGLTPRDVPNVEGKTLDEAKKILADEGFRVGGTSTRSSQTVPKDRVIGTQPSAGEDLSPDEPVTVVVSGGMSMPGLVGTGGDTAANRLRSLGLNVTVQKKRVEGKEPGSVLSQDPAEGTGVSRGDDVTLVVNERDCIIDAGPFQFGCDDGAGAEKIPVPDVTNRSVADATKILEDSGFKVNAQGWGDTVRFQAPGADSSAARGSTVTIVRGP
ncbi:Stk1 family PASTA domain-containing Ser/Thr kinase [Actinomadura sp. WMMB 499]|uniref:Stk1 family PASTA domain-containing Ser/Thr kinase n=1 Tax=Actinomadura sp. WMMB 499 TaxID=1219491 RepID=UPI0012491945|nr:Stk1 family PASTA domain-containing Ser/Thr kinase [Actinomadura sp. WMMB 499]QFG25836.1 Stk1 family PASTA domain-containing Ser/Thr kinase [Actinomadura sp. WMMB 499]